MREHAEKRFFFITTLKENFIIIKDYKETLDNKEIYSDNFAWITLCVMNSFVLLIF